jgi:Xaa-Pro aminopeptidase
MGPTQAERRGLQDHGLGRAATAWVLTGSETERLFHAFIPTKGDHPIWFYPALDRDLVRSWWYEDGDMYFDWLTVAGAAPQEGKVIKGPTQDQWRWALEGLKRRGFAGKKLAADKELVPSAQKIVVDVLKNPMESAAEHCLYLRERKTPEELALCRRAYRYFDRIHAYARDVAQGHAVLGRVHGRARRAVAADVAPAVERGMDVD